jgi:Zn-dependent M28 family amino/carboxypeptidase
MRSCGLEPLGVGAKGGDRFLEPFAVGFYDGKGSSEGPRWRVKSWNALGVRRGDGTTPEAVLVLAHVDGRSAQQNRALGVRGYQGANDNASAVAAALRIAAKLQRLERLRGRPLPRHVVFALVSAEEQGLKGSEALARYSRQLGDFRFVAAVNFEMVGRGDPHAIQVWGGNGYSPQQAAENPVYQQAMAVTPRGRTARVVPGHQHYDGQNNWWDRSDHFVFARVGVPSVLYFGAADGYHTAADDRAHVDVATVEAVASHAFRLVAGLAAGGPAGPGAQLPSNSSHLPNYQVIDAPGPTPVLRPFRGPSRPP